MSRKKKEIMLSLGLILIGLVIAAVSMASVGFDFSRLSTAKYVTTTHEVSDAFRNLTITGDTEDVAFVLSGDGACRVVCHEQEDHPHRVEVRDDTLIIETPAESGWRFFDFSFMAEGPSITVYLPAEAALGALSARLSTGDISLTGLEAESIRLSASTGSLRLTDVRCAGKMEVSVSTGSTLLENVSCGSLTSSGSTGSLEMKNTVATGAFALQRSTGSIRFEACDAAEITARTSTGSITGTLKTEKIFSAHSNTGSVDVPQTASGGKCELSASTGSIRIEIQDQSKGR